MSLIVIKFCINERFILETLLPSFEESLPVENIVSCQTLLKETFL